MRYCAHDTDTLYIYRHIIAFIPRQRELNITKVKCWWFVAKEKISWRSCSYECTKSVNFSVYACFCVSFLRKHCISHKMQKLRKHPQGDTSRELEANR